MTKSLASLLLLGSAALTGCVSQHQHNAVVNDYENRISQHKLVQDLQEDALDEHYKSFYSLVTVVEKMRQDLANKNELLDTYRKLNQQYATELGTLKIDYAKLKMEYEHLIPQVPQNTE